MDALHYEYLIRKAFNCGRGGANGMAQADDYRKLERAERILETRNSIASVDDLEYDYRSAAMKISMNVRNALNKVINDFHFTSENKPYKEQLIKLSNEISMTMDKKIIDKSINEAHIIFKELKLQMA